jgi:hypothetical protein
VALAAPVNPLDPAPDGAGVALQAFQANDVLRADGFLGADAAAGAALGATLVDDGFLALQLDGPERAVHDADPAAGAFILVDDQQLP